MKLRFTRIPLASLLLLCAPGAALAQPTPAPAPEPAPPAPAPDAPPPAAAPETTPAAEPLPDDAAATTTAPVEPTAEEAAAPAPSLAPSISGFVDGTYNYNLNKPAGGVTPFHSYTADHHTFLLNTAHLALTGNDGHLSYAVEIDGGSDARITSGGDDDFDVQEAYAAYVCDCGFGFKVGKFVTFNGIEVIESGSNPTISRGFLFGLAEPFTHVGGVLTYKINDVIDVAAGAVNGWDVMADNNSTKTMVGKLGITTDQFLATVSAYAGPEQTANNDDWRYTFDATGVYKLAKVDLWGQFNYGMEEVGDESVSWWGAGLQPVVRLGDELSLGGRLEVFGDPDGARTLVGPDGQTLFNVSVAPAYAVHKHLVLRAELRLDLSSEEVYANTDGDVESMQVIGLTEALVIF